MELTDIFEEWSAYAGRKALLPRDIDSEAILRTSKTKIVTITGVRRCGKSSFLMLLFQRLKREGQSAGYVNLEDSRLTDDPDVLDEVLKWFGDSGYLLLDEVPSAHDWQGWLARTH